MSRALSATLLVLIIIAGSILLSLFAFDLPEAFHPEAERLHFLKTVGQIHRNKFDAVYKLECLRDEAKTTEDRDRYQQDIDKVQAFYLEQIKEQYTKSGRAYPSSD